MGSGGSLLLPPVRVVKKKKGDPVPADWDGVTPHGLPDGPGVKTWLVIGNEGREGEEGLHWRLTPNFLHKSNAPYPLHTHTVRGQVIEGAEGEGRDYVWCGPYLLLPVTGIHAERVLRELKNGEPVDEDGPEARCLYVETDPDEWPEVYVLEVTAGIVPSR